MKNEERNRTIDKIISYSKELRLPAIRRNILEEVEEEEKKNLSYQDFLCGLLLKEYDLRVENGKKNRIRVANFPYKKYIEDLSLEDLPHDAKKKLKVLVSLDFIKNGQNVIFAGSPGTGKTHISIGLGIKAAMAGYKVMFATVPLLINRLKESRSEKTLQMFESRFEKYDLGACPKIIN
jgi:DNA replication protein DnaC